MLKIEIVEKKLNNQNMVSLLLTTLLLLFILTILYKNLKLKIRNNELINDLIQSNIDNIILVNKFEIENSNDYLNFLDSSRADAYIYIENVQSELNDFKNNTEKIVNYFNEFGEVASSFPLYTHMKLLVESSEKIYKLLPDNKNS